MSERRPEEACHPACRSLFVWLILTAAIHHCRPCWLSPQRRPRRARRLVNAQTLQLLQLAASPPFSCVLYSFIIVSQLLSPPTTPPPQVSLSLSSAFLFSLFVNLFWFIPFQSIFTFFLLLLQLHANRSMQNVILCPLQLCVCGSSDILDLFYTADEHISGRAINVKKHQE